MTRGQVDAWNAAHPIGTMVAFASDDGMVVEARTTWPATWLESGIVLDLAGIGEVDFSRCVAVRR